MMDLISAFGTKPLINIPRIKLKLSALQLLVHIGSWIPFIVLVIDYNTNNLTIDPIREATLRTGRTALKLLILSLACTPLNILFRYRPAIKVRRPLGVYSGLYASLHLLIFVAVDYSLRWSLIYEAIFEKRYALVGFAAFVILFLLLVTSTKGWQKRLGKRWTTLHKWVYLAALLVIVHFLWLVKEAYGRPITYGMVVVILLAIRFPAIKKRIADFRSQRTRKKRQPEMADSA